MSTTRRIAAFALAFGVAASFSAPLRAQNTQSPHRKSAKKNKQRKQHADTVPPPKTNDPMPEAKPRKGGPPAVPKPDPREHPVKPADPTNPTTKKR